MGLRADIFEAAPRRTSVLGRLAGSGGGQSLMLNAHCDTADAGGMVDPFSGTIRGGKVYGRGAYDMKGSLAACMAAAKALVDAGAPLRGDVLVAAVADEEYGSLGTSGLISGRACPAPTSHPCRGKACLALASREPGSQGRNRAVAAPG